MALPATRQYKSHNTIIDVLKLGVFSFHLLKETLQNEFTVINHLAYKLSFTDGVFYLVVNGEKQTNQKVFLFDTYMLVIDTSAKYCTSQTVFYNQITINN
jgi:hypothetical protein